jgi:hypothetical protein
MPHEQPAQPTPEDAYEQNYAAMLDCMGRINARLAAKRRVEKPRDWEHVGEQEEVLAMLRSVAEFLGA